MSSKPKIVVFHLKELIYTVIFVILGILLILLLVFMFLSPEDQDDNGDAAASKYVPGKYSSSLVMNDTSMEIEVIVDENDYIKSVRVVNNDEAVTTIYPLIAPAIENIEEQIIENQSLENITYSEDNKYTSLTLLDTIEQTLAKAEKSTD